MSVVNATYAEQNFASCLANAARSPLVIDKPDGQAIVMRAYSEFQRLHELEDHLWALCAEESEKEGFLGAEASEAFLKERLARVRTGDLSD